RSYMRDKLCYDLSGAIGAEVHMRTTWANLILNGEYRGNYRIGQQIRIAPERVNIFNWEDAAENAALAISKARGFTADMQNLLVTQMSEKLMWMDTDEVIFNGATYRVSDYFDYPSNTGGVLLEMDNGYRPDITNFKTDLNQVINFSNPEFALTNPGMVQHYKDYLNSFGRAVFADNHYDKYNGKDTHYTELFDMDALLQYWLINEVFPSYEIGRKSTWFYKDIEGPFKMGPIWDMDWSAAGMGQSESGSNWKVTNQSVEGWWYKGITADPYFCARAQEYYWRVHDELTKLNKTGGLIDQNYGYLKEAANADCAMWPYDRPHGKTFDEAVERLQRFFNSRFTWMDTQLNTTASAVTSMRYYTASSSVTVNFLDEADTLLPADTTSTRSPAKAYNAKGPVKVSVGVTGATVVEVEIYANGIYCGKAPVTAGLAEMILDPECFAAEHINVVHAIGVNAAGNRTTQKNYATLRQAEVPTITVGSQSATRTYGQAGGAVAFSIATQGDGTFAPAIIWEKGSAPAGVTALAFTEGNSKLTMNVANTAAAGSYKFTVQSTGYKSATGTLTIGRDQAVSVNITVPNITKTAFEAKDQNTTTKLMTLAGTLPANATVSLKGGGTASLPLQWQCVTPYNAKGTVYTVEGFAVGNNNIMANGAAARFTITVTPIFVPPITFADIEISSVAGGGKKTPFGLGTDVLPTTGSVTAQGVASNYTIRWSAQTIDIGVVGETVTFIGVVTCSERWMSAADVTRKVTVVQGPEPTTEGPTATPSPTPSPTPTIARRKGDANGDGKVDIEDILRVRDHIFGIVKLSGVDFWAADTDDDKRIDVFDILGIRDIIFGG
ncbi:MAG: CotH kinase family protein, partial [Clostridia bacterium]|nr:CotH kinase family protein [Clostridia bacterium]